MSDQQEVTIKVESTPMFRRKLQLMLIGFVPFTCTAFAGILIMMDERGSFPRLVARLFPYGLVISVIIVGLAVSLHFFFRWKIILRKTPSGDLEMSVMDHKDNLKDYNRGEWTATAHYKKEHYRLGTYRKDLYLTLYCNSEPFCMFRHKTPAADTPPEGFTENALAASMSWAVPVFFTPETVRIYRIMEQNGKMKKQDVDDYTRP